jgi:HD-GYP domain-containing protein (c-di-GMP phosphodiesterase class II)
MDHPPHATGVPVAEVAAALASAADIRIGEPLAPSFRACLLAMAFGGFLGLTETELRDLYYVSLLAGLGSAEAVATRHMCHELHDPEMMHLVSMYNVTTKQFYSLSALVVKRDLLQIVVRSLGLRSDVMVALELLVECRDGRSDSGNSGDDGAILLARIAQLARHAELLARLGGAELAINMIWRYSGTVYDPSLAAAFCQAANELCLCLMCESEWEAVLAAEPGPQSCLRGAQLELALKGIGDAADLHARGAVGHARATAALSEQAARRSGLPREDVTAIRFASLVQDLGMLCIPARTCQKPGGFSESEREHVRLHPYYTERILARSRGLAPIAALAGRHHERLDGSGAYRGLAAAQLPPSARILAASDVYAALVEPRPYREAFTPIAAAEALHQEVRAGRLDGTVVNAVLAAAGHRQRCKRHRRVAGLTDREIEVLRLMSSGLVNHEMAASLGLSTHTIDHHIRHIYDKLDISSRAEAVRFALQHQILAAAGS